MTTETRTRAKWTEQFRVGERVEFNVPAYGWCGARVVRKTRTGVPIVRCDGAVGLTFAAAKKDLRRTQDGNSTRS